MNVQPGERDSIRCRRCHHTDVSTRVRQREGRERGTFEQSVEEVLCHNCGSFLKGKWIGTKREKIKLRGSIEGVGRYEQPAESLRQR